LENKFIDTVTNVSAYSIPAYHMQTHGMHTTALYK
jgi:hypothetical protein